MEQLAFLKQLVWLLVFLLFEFTCGFFNNTHAFSKITESSPYADVSAGFLKFVTTVPRG